MARELSDAYLSQLVTHEQLRTVLEQQRDAQEKMRGDQHAFFEESRQGAIRVEVKIGSALGKMCNDMEHIKGALSENRRHIEGVSQRTKTNEKNVLELKRSVDAAASQRIPWAHVGVVLGAIVAGAGVVIACVKVGAAIFEAMKL